MTETQTHKGTANERIGQQAVDLADVRKTRDWYIEKYLAILDQRNELHDAMRGILSDTCIDIDELAPALNALAAIRYQARAAIEKLQAKP